MLGCLLSLCPHAIQRSPKFEVCLITSLTPAFADSFCLSGPGAGRCCLLMGIPKSAPTFDATFKQLELGVWRAKPRQAAYDAQGMKSWAQVPMAEILDTLAIGTLAD